MICDVQQSLLPASKDRGARVAIRETARQRIVWQTGKAHLLQLHRDGRRGNTLALAGGLYQNDGGSIIIILDGGGTLDITGRIDGWSTTLT